MRVTANVHVLARVKKPWVDDAGNERQSYSANIMQSNGEIISTIRLTADQYAKIENGKSYTILADYGTGKNGAAYLKIVDINESK